MIVVMIVGMLLQRFSRSCAAVWMFPGESVPVVVRSISFEGADTMRSTSQCRHAVGVCS